MSLDSAPQTEPRKTVRITVDLDPADHRALKIAAAEAGMTISEIVRSGLRGFVRRVAEGQQPTGEGERVRGRAEPHPKPVRVGADENPFAAVLLTPTVIEQS